MRFDIFERIEHIIFLTSFTILGLTGLVQKFSASPISLFIMQTLGGIEGTRQIHHIAAFVMMWVTVYHIIAVLYRVIVLRVPWTMMPLLDDFTHLFQDIAYYPGFPQTPGLLRPLQLCRKSGISGGRLGHNHHGHDRFYDVEPDHHRPDICPARPSRLPKLPMAAKPSWPFWRSSSGICTTCI